MEEEEEEEAAALVTLAFNTEMERERGGRVWMAVMVNE